MKLNPWVVLTWVVVALTSFWALICVMPMIAFGLAPTSPGPIIGWLYGACPVLQVVLIARRFGISSAITLAAVTACPLVVLLIDVLWLGLPHWPLA